MATRSTGPTGDPLTQLETLLKQRLELETALAQVRAEIDLLLGEAAFRPTRSLTPGEQQIDRLFLEDHRPPRPQPAEAERPHQEALRRQRDRATRRTVVSPAGTLPAEVLARSSDLLRGWIAAVGRQLSLGQHEKLSLAIVGVLLLVNGLAWVTIGPGSRGSGLAATQSTAAPTANTPVASLPSAIPGTPSKIVGLPVVTPSGPPPTPPNPTALPTAESAASQAAAQPTAQSSAPRSYVVRPGDTLWSIASSNGMKVEDLMKANDLTDRNFIWSGQRLIIPDLNLTP